jgi:hypothetical protein
MNILKFNGLDRTSRSPSVRPIILAVLAVSFAALCSSPASALDNDSDDYSAGALPAGTNLALLYYQHVDRNAGYSNGQRVSDGGLSSDVGILRGVHFAKWGPFIADPQFLLPFGRLDTSRDVSSLGSAQGVGDLIATATIWLYNHPDTGYYFGITPAIYVPIGSYDKNKALNLGNNRWQYLLQAGYVMPIVPRKLSLELVGDVTLYGDNNEYGPMSKTLSEDPVMELQAWLSYSVSPKFDIRVGSTFYSGGRTKVDGVSNNDRQRTVNGKVGFGWAFAPSWQVVGLYGQDIDDHNGLKETTRINLRLLKAF